jgi:DNA-binding response OmpR family regulator
MSRILIIEDDQAILRGLKDNLEFESYDVLTAADGKEGYDLARTADPDLIVLDLMLPRMNGYEICQQLRSVGRTMPILILTARGEEVERIRGLDLGADDYVTKPFSVPELLARVRAVLRRTERSGTQLKINQLCFDDVTVDFNRFEARNGDQELRLSRKEYGVLRLLAEREGEVVSRDELLDHVWGYDRYPTTRTVDNHIASLRAKLEQNPSEPRRLLTVHGVGYKLVIDSEI